MEVSNAKCRISFGAEVSPACGVGTYFQGQPGITRYITADDSQPNLVVYSVRVENGSASQKACQWNPIDGTWTGADPGDNFVIIDDGIDVDGNPLPTNMAALTPIWINIDATYIGTPNSSPIQIMDGDGYLKVDAYQDMPFCIPFYANLDPVSIQITVPSLTKLTLTVLAKV